MFRRLGKLLKCSLLVSVTRLVCFDAPSRGSAATNLDKDVRTDCPDLLYALHLRC